MQQGERGGINELTRKLTKRSTNRIGGTGQLRPLLPTARVLFPHLTVDSWGKTHRIHKPRAQQASRRKRLHQGLDLIHPIGSSQRCALQKRGIQQQGPDVGGCARSPTSACGQQGRSGRNRNPGVRDGPNHHPPFCVIQEQAGPCMP
jgi:hypothetical protein